MHDKLLETCANEFEKYIKSLFKNPRMLTKTLAEVPVVGGVFIPDLMDQTPFLLLRVCKALCCRERFYQDEPSWGPLPLHEDIRTAMEDDDNTRCKLLGYYGSSLAGADWDYDGHPRFAAFASGLLAYEHTPDCIRNDRDLQREFPLRELEGLCDGWLSWRNPEQIALDRENLRRIAVMEAREAAEARNGAG